MTKTEEELWYQAGQFIGLCMNNGLTVDEARKAINLAKDILEGADIIYVYAENKIKAD